MSKKPVQKKVIKVNEELDDMSETLDETDDAINDDDDSFDQTEEFDSNSETDVDESDTYNNCILNKVIQDEVDDIDNDDNSEIEEQVPEEKLLKGNDRISSNKLTKYEMVRILGERTLQLQKGAKPLIKNYEGLNYDKIAEEELKLNMVPYKIKRTLPNGKYEIWTLDELFKDHLLTLL